MLSSSSYARGCAALLLLASISPGCSSPSAGPDAGAVDASTADVGDDAAPVEDDASVVDVGLDAPAPNDASVSFTAMTLVTTLSEDCMPAVPPDPLPITGTLRVTNDAGSPLGPLHVESGLLVQLLGGQTLATFDVDPIDLPAIAPGATQSVAFSKVAGSLAGGAGLSGCDIVPCGTPVRVALVLTGPGVPDGARAWSEPLTVGCVF